MKLTATLEAEQWNALFAVLNEMPFRVVDPIAPLMREIHAQGMAQLRAAEMPPTLNERVAEAAKLQGSQNGEEIPAP